MRPSFELVVLDWDGTVADSEMRIVGAIESAVSELRLPPPACHPREIIGLGMREAVESMYPAQADRIHEPLVAAYRARFLAAAADPVALFDGVREAVVAMSDAGFLVAVATGKSRRGLARELAESGLDQWVVASRCADEAPSKPHPAMLSEIMAELGVEPGVTLMVGDTTYDLEMAQRAGAASLGVRTGVHDEARLRAFAPLDILDAAADLPGWLGIDVPMNEENDGGA